MALLEVRGLRKRYLDGTRELCVLDGVSFDVFEGDFAGLWGPSRSGKSTLLRILAGLEPADGGSIRFDGVELTDMAPDTRARLLRNEIALASFRWPVHRNRAACEHVALAACADTRVTGRRARAQARRALHRTGVLECAERPLERLSFDEHVRVELARALVRDPSVLLIDDPPALQSPSENSKLEALVHSLHEQGKRTVLLARAEAGRLQGGVRTMALGRGRLRTIEDLGVVVQFPQRTGTGGP